MGPFLTSKENIALDFAFKWQGESRINRTFAEYLAIAKKLPSIEALHAYINVELAKIHATGKPPYEICYFKVGDRGHWYESYPASLSRETIRKALKKSGMLDLKFWKAP